MEDGGGRWDTMEDGGIRLIVVDINWRKLGIRWDTWDNAIQY